MSTVMNDGVRVPAPGSGSRADRMSQPTAADLLRDVAASNGVCIRPVTLKVLDETTGGVHYVDVPCGSTREAVCPACSAKAKALRVTQCREGWHRDTEPWDERDAEPVERDLVLVRADVTAERDRSRSADDPDEADAATAALNALDNDLAAGGVRGTLEPSTMRRRTRSTRRREDAPDLPRRASNGSTLGRAFIAKGDRVYRPSMFITVTLPSYGAVHADGTPRRPSTYDYGAQARDNLHFARLLDRLFQNLRRVAGYDVQYFATIEPQRRGALHAHIAVRGTIARSLVRQLLDATYHQVWWPSTSTVHHDDDHPPVWVPDDPDAEQAGPGGGHYVDPATGGQLTAFDDAVDNVEDPLHVIRFGSVADMQGILTGTPEADRRIGYLCKYLTKSIDAAMDHGRPPGHSDDGEPDARTAAPHDARRATHVDRLVDALRYEPCSPTCANWLRYGVEPRHARPRMRAGACRSKAHARTHLGHAGRRVLVSRRWSGKTLTDHRAERSAFVRAVLLEAADREVEEQLRQGLQAVDDADGATDAPDTVDRDERPPDVRQGGWSVRPPDVLDAEGQPRRLVWEVAKRGDPIPPLATRLLHAVANRRVWRRQYEEAMTRARLDTEVPDVA
ncbi:replication initiator [Aquipuribacter hungaricus]|uniref:Replication initiator n=1 Tax=Aquipuribacter hungaricus TaxID=545624 RepID=A0ABV7WCA5_9MICO